MSVLLGIGLALAASTLADDWPQFRGPDGNGVSAHGRIPSEWSSTNHLAWRVPVPGSGWSQPVTVGNQVFLTTAVGGPPARPSDYASGVSDPYTAAGETAPAPDTLVEWKVLALDLRSGARQWERTVVSARPRYPVHPSNTYASETPAADSQAVYAWFGAAGTLAALDHDGSLRWRRELGVFRQQGNFGTGSSLRLYRGRLYVQCFSEEKALLVCLGTHNGRTLWQLDRPSPGTAWCTPLVWHNRQRTELVVYGQKLMTSQDPLHGRELWRASGIDMPGPSSCAADDRHLFFGFASPLKRTSLYALEAGAKGDQSLAGTTKTFACETWSVPGAASGVASPVVAAGCLYVARDAFVGCYDVATGREHFRERLPGFRCVVASPVAVGPKVLVVDESGLAVVLEAGPQFAVAGHAKLDDTFWASPAVARGALLLRGMNHLYCLRGDQGTGSPSSSRSTTRGR